MKCLSESAQAIMGFGYTARESEFLYLVATHSGFFVQRQFAAYIDISGRGPVTDFVRKALHKKHIREYLPEHGSQKTYHVFSRNIYAAIGKENSRNRKTGRYGLLDKPPVRMLTLDFVLANPTQTYLEEEADKVEFFTNQRQISLDSLPSRNFAGSNAALTRRYFVERFPIFLSGTEEVSTLNFTYVEDQVRSLQTYSSFLERYRALFHACQGQFKLIFVSDSPQSFRAAEKQFYQLYSPAGQESQIKPLARFFRLRKMAEEKRFKELRHQDVVDWQRGLKRYAGTEFEKQYATWKETGETPALEVQGCSSSATPQFEACLISPGRVRQGLSVLVQPACPDAPGSAPQELPKGA